MTPALTMLRELGIKPMYHLPRHSAAKHPKGDEPGRCASGAIARPKHRGFEVRLSAGEE